MKLTKRQLRHLIKEEIEHMYTKEISDIPLEDVVKGLRITSNRVHELEQKVAMIINMLKRTGMSKEYLDTFEEE